MQHSATDRDGRPFAELDIDRVWLQAIAPEVGRQQRRR